MFKRNLWDKTLKTPAVGLQPSPKTKQSRCFLQNQILLRVNFKNEFAWGHSLTFVIREFKKHSRRLH